MYRMNSGCGRLLETQRCCSFSPTRPILRRPLCSFLKDQGYPLCEVTEPSQRVEWTDAANGTFYSQSRRQEVGRNPNALKIVGPKSEYVTYAMIGGEKSSRHESEKITALKDGLDGHDR
jgi:hypothetical protein